MFVCHVLWLAFYHSELEYYTSRYKTAETKTIEKEQWIPFLKQWIPKRKQWVDNNRTSQHLSALTMGR